MTKSHLQNIKYLVINKFSKYIKKKKTIPAVHGISKSWTKLSKLTELKNPVIHENKIDVTLYQN